HEHVTCNFCSERCVKKRQANHKKKTKTDTSLNTIVPTISISISGVFDFLQVNNILKDYDDLEQISETSLFFDDDSANIIEVKEHDSKSSEEPTKFALEIELDSDLLDIVEIDQNLETSSLNLEKIKDGFAQLTKNLQDVLRHILSVHHERTEVKKQITRRSKDGVRLALQYNDFPVKSSELYYYLTENNLILSIHTKEQIYYWVSVYGRQTYLTNQDNQLLSSKTYFEQFELAARRFKILSYFDNDFVRALEFITSLFNRIGVQNIKEIVIDSTFKTNQKRFELFVVNSNCGRYDMPLAYLYLLTSNNLSVTNFYPSNGITTQNPVIEDHHLENSQDISMIVFEKKIEERQEKYSQYEKKFKKALELYKREMNNDNFVKNFDTLLRPFIKAVNGCEDALQTYKQQNTQKSSNEKLAFWL
ncbi:6540_t:CDS:2, partial [Cetraspora pellucida]